MTRSTIASTDPRKVGGRYFNGYWQEEYTVEAIDLIDGFKWFTVRWAAGHQTRHCTQWDARKDQIVSEPDSTSPAYMLGIRHGTERTEPFGDLDDGGSALLMDALGQAGPTTEANHAFRVMLLDAYSDGLRAGRQVTA